MDLQALKLVDALGTRATSEYWNASGQRVVRVQLTGRASDVSEVSVFGLPVIEWSAVSTKVIDAVIPSPYVGVDLEDLEFLVLSSNLTGTRTQNEILYTIGRESSWSTGSQVLIQTFLRFMLMTPGSDPRDAGAGVGLLRLVGQAHVSNFETMRAHISRLHHMCKRQIIERQTRTVRSGAGYDPREILRDAILDGVQLEAGNQIGIYSTLVDAANNPVKVPIRV